MNGTDCVVESGYHFDLITYSGVIIEGLLSVDWYGLLCAM